MTIFLLPPAAALVAFFLLRVSGVPMLDEHLAATKPGFDAYRARVPALLARRRGAGRQQRRAGGQ